MKLKDILLINIKKLKTKTKKALFLIIPIFVLITLSVILSSQVKNIQAAATNSVFGTIAESYKLIQVSTQANTGTSSGGFDPSQMFNSSSSSSESTSFSTLDEQVVAALTHVESVSLQSTLPVSNIKTTDLFSDKTVELDSLSTLDTNTAALYTTDDFTYTEGEAIPIILNASSLTYSYEDWGDSTTITMDMSSMKRDSSSGAPTQRLSFLKSEAIEYDSATLVGTTFTLEIGNLSDIQDYTTSRSSGTEVITKLTDEELATKVSERETAIAEYWDYDKISTPITYTFVVVGVIDDASAVDSTAYIPEGFADTLMTDYIAHEINSRNGTEISTDVLNSSFTGITYDGVELTTSTSGMMGQMMNRMRDMNSGTTPTMPQSSGGTPPEGMGIGSFDASGYLIPGLVIEVDDDNAVVGTVDDSTIYTSSTKYADSMNVIIDNVVNRDSVIEALNTAGYAVQGTDDVAVFDELEDTLNTVSKVFMISFIVLVTAIVALTMSKFISESIREIGIFRAIGMRKSAILAMFISQSLLYVLIGYVGGVALGIGLNFLTGHFVSGWFDTFLTETVAKTFNVVNTVDSSIFSGINFTSIGIYTALLIGISSIISIITSLSASKVSPVEAIKNE